MQTAFGRAVTAVMTWWGGVGGLLVSFGGTGRAGWLTDGFFNLLC